MRMKICFIAELPHARMGGAELQCYMIAERLALKGYEIHYICYEKAPEIPKINLTIHNVGRDASRGALKHVISFFSALKEADCDLYLQTCPRLATGLTALFCKLHHRVFVYRAVNLKDADLSFSKEYYWPDVKWWFKKAYSYGIKRADAIVCNSVRVAEKFKEKIKSPVIVIPNGHPIKLLKNVPLKERYILWAARLTEVKRPHLLIEIARRLPQYTFIMVGRGRYKLPELPKNVKFLGFKTGEALRSLYEKAAIFLNTSLIEGFPNTLIEAGMYYTPYITFYDPDDVVKRCELGFHVNNVEEAVQSIKELMQNPDLRRKMGMNIRKYVEKNHNIEMTVKLYEKLFKELLNEV
ncbi:MAG TPA: glycosyltransferase [Deltaproteobacteria bacterium]|nr:glycosyltransferase [Deltaproteobacteria bacterium]